jgi:hypothetical protein
MTFTERSIAGYLARVIFLRKYLLLVPNCSWPGSECDLLAVTPNLRVIDVEIKISRADLRADAKKEKWFEYEKYQPDVWPRAKHRIAYPRRVWKHYYCLPRTIWTPDLYADMNEVSGLLLIDDAVPREAVGYGVTRIPERKGFRIRVERRAKPDIKADKITPADAVDIARLASLRMWDAYDALDKIKVKSQSGVRAL